MRFIYLCVLFIVSSTSLSGQDSIAVISANLLEDLLENDEEANYDFFSLYEDLQLYLRNPLNINKATEEELHGLQLLSDIQIRDILQYRADFGPFLSKYELQTIPSLDFGVLSALVPLVTEGGERKNFSAKTMWKESSSNLFLKWKNVIEDRKGFLDDSYLGDRNHLFARYNFSSGRNIRAGFTAEKDPGEQFFAGSNKSGFDYYTGFLYLRDLIPHVRHLSLGDYTVSMGQGLILHNSFGGGKSSFVTNIKRGGQPLRPYSSVVEANFLRGAAATIDLRSDLSLTAFYSSKAIDGSVSQDTILDSGFQQFSAIVVDGFHRTENEIAKENSVIQTSVGGILSYKKRNFSMSFNGLQQDFTLPLSSGDALYRKYRFEGDRLINLSVDYTYRYRNFNLFGEAARSDNGGLAFLNGALISLGRSVDLAIAHRHYEKDYQVLNGNAFGESTLPINEQGIYLALKVRVDNNWTLSSYFDTWTHPWLRFQSDAPSSGKEYLFKAEYNKKRRFNAYLQYRYEQKQENSASASRIDVLVPTGQHRGRLNITNTVSKSLTLRNRLEFSIFDDSQVVTNGYLIYQDVIYKPVGKSYSFTARYALFDTDGFDTRIYTFENDILYEFSIPFFADRGSRFYINWRQRIGRHLTVEARYSRTYYDNRESIGSGGQEIDGNVRSEVKLQIKYRF